MSAAWNHNIHYHGRMLRAVPANCGLALDVGCGYGLLARKLVSRCAGVVGIDRDAACIASARAAAAGDSRIEFVEGDVLTHRFGDRCFDFVVAVATLHHLPLRAALVRFAELLRPGGVLAVTGLYRPETMTDFANACVAWPVSRVLRSVKRYEEMGAPVQLPRESLREIRSACGSVLPGAEVRRLLLFRYSLVWKKPAAG